MFAEVIEKVETGEHLTPDQAQAVMEDLLSGRLADTQIVNLLAALRAKGETVDELVGFARAMRGHAQPVFSAEHKMPKILLDTCGTGGDASGTFNISTAAAFVVSGAGVSVAKHGNRSVSSKCGSADVLEALGVRLDLPAKEVGAAIAQIGIGFLFAPAVHAATRHAMAARRQLGGRTAFNLLGPLTNPAGASVQVVGVFARGLTEPMASALSALGVERAFVVHGAEGLDEISLTGETYVTEVTNGLVRSYTLAPEDFGLPRAKLAALVGGDARTNAEILRRILDGQAGPPRDIVLANAAAALLIAGRASALPEGVRLASESIDSGAARAKLDHLVAFTTR